MKIKIKFVIENVKYSLKSSLNMKFGSKKIFLISLVVIIGILVLLFGNQLGFFSSPSTLTKDVLTNKILSFQQGNGGFSSYYNSTTSILSTSDAITGLDYLNSMEKLDKEKVISYIQSKKNPDGSYSESKETKMLSTDLAVYILIKLNATEKIDRSSVLSFVDSQGNNDESYLKIFIRRKLNDTSGKDVSSVVDSLMKNYKSGHFEVENDIVRYNYLSMLVLSLIKQTW